MNRFVIARFHEIALKGKNRPFFARQLVGNLREATRGLGVESVWDGRTMVGLKLAPDAEWPALEHQLKRVFGVVNFSIVNRAEPNLESIKSLVTKLANSKPFASFRITANRADKKFPLTSMELNRELGALVGEATGARVDLKQPEAVFYVDIMPRDAYVYVNKVQASGGLPVGASAPVLTLLSGGIDSPVSAWRMMKRGCPTYFLHFHSYPLVDTSSMEKAAELVQALTTYQYESTLFLAPLAEIQKTIILSVPAAYRVVLYRRFMFRIAEQVARREGALALVTGESVGQVSSQTVENIAAIDAVASMPVLRPLIGMDKVEIIDQARALGTYAVSIIPDQDCCSLFTPTHPVIRSKASELERFEEDLDVEGLVSQAVSAIEVRHFRH
ncbi:MAG: thiamine biosynthesis protein ThiI [Chloroflexi bacterium]|jgi:thiamine biosynthesis protein ThiI|nr:MAG: thiamine biosynthesis protein ThiI [Chloroflexota bacterium]